MDEEQLAIVLNMDDLRANFVEKLIRNTKKIFRNAIKRIIELILSILSLLILLPLMISVKLRKIATQDKTDMFCKIPKIGKNGKIINVYEFNVSSEDEFLKTSGLYKLPQIINVLIGNMSFVGPKAYDPEQKDEIGMYYSYIIQHKPGITGIPQISGENINDIDSRVKLDLRYHYRKTITYDFKILFITIFVTLKRRGTYKLAKQFKELWLHINEVVFKFIKRAIDIIGALLGILLLIPTTVIIKILSIVTREEGPLFYVQERMGKDGKTFKMYKFRTMVPGADEKLKELLANDPKAAEEWKINKKLKNDPRTTKLGTFLRKSSIDEMPQFINVLKGDMSLVGPRPYMLREKEDMGIYYKSIVNLKPGLTGLWQVSGRSNTTFEERIYLDRKYYCDRTIIGDVKIIFKTVYYVLKREGAQ